MKGFVVQDGMFRLVDGKDLMHARMKRLLFTPISSMVGFIGKGSRVLNYFWEGATKQSAASILTEVKLLVSAYMREVRLKTVGISIKTPENSAGAMLECQLEVEHGGISSKVVVKTINQGA